MACSRSSGCPRSSGSRPRSRGTILSALALAAKIRRVCGCGTASSAEFSIASSGTRMRAAHFSPCAWVSSTDHCDSHARSVEKRPMPDRSRVHGLRVAEVARADGRSLGSIAGSRKRGSASVRWVTKPRSSSPPPRSRRRVEHCPSPRRCAGAGARAARPGTRAMYSGDIRRPVRIARVVDVELDLAVVRIVLVAHRRIDHLARASRRATRAPPGRRSHRRAGASPRRCPPDRRPACW